MKAAHKKFIINMVIAVVLTIVSLFEFNYTTGSDVAFAFGIVCLGLGLINFLIGLVLLIADKNTVRDGWLLSGAMLLVVSGISCGGGLSGMRF